MTETTNAPATSLAPDDVAAVAAVDWDSLLATAAPEKTRATVAAYTGPIPEKLRALITQASADGKRYVMKCAGQAVYDQFVAMGLAVAATLPEPRNNFYPRARFKDDQVVECSFVVEAKRTRPSKSKAVETPAPPVETPAPEARALAEKIVDDKPAARPPSGMSNRSSGKK